MAIMSIQSLLESVETAIVTVLTAGQSYQIGERRYTRADLAELQNMRRELKAQYDSQNTGSARNLVRFRDCA